MWSGTLISTTDGILNDWVVLLINGQNNTAVMNATFTDIFVDFGPKGTSAQSKLSWEVRDLWANRMTDAEAQAIINGVSVVGNSTTAVNGTGVLNGLYNATATSYAEGLAARDERLLGNVTTTVGPSGTIMATVDAHGAAMFRLRALPTGVTKRDEL
jgi:alpha-galactosidase